MTAVRISNLSFRYPDGKQALSDVSLSIEEGQTVALIGPNGAGKSTLLLHLNGLLPESFDSHRPVEIFGRPVGPQTLLDIRREVGFLFQDPDDQLFCPTVFEDVAFGPEQLGLRGEDLRRRVAEALARVGLTGFEQRAPHHLSGGEKRRVCLAGVLACESRILVLDEPTSDLDPRGRRELKALLATLPVTRIIATHDLELVVELCSRAVLLDGGRVIADGPPAQLLSDERLMFDHGLEKPHILMHHHPHGPLRAS
jgi:cobalt/nickel transport system ATP-binding protein